MANKMKFRKMLMASMFGVLLAACGSGESVIAADDDASSNNVEQQATTTTAAGEAIAEEEGPPEGFARVTFNFSSEDDVIESVYGGDLTTFEVRSATGSETVVFGFLDEAGTIDIPAEFPARLRGETLGVEAEFPDDEFCWWSGFALISDRAEVLELNVELEAVCA